MKTFHVEFQRNGRHIMSMTVQALTPMGAITFSCLRPQDRREGKGRGLRGDGGQWVAIRTA